MLILLSTSRTSRRCCLHAFFPTPPNRNPIHWPSSCVQVQDLYFILVLAFFRGLGDTDGVDRSGGESCSSSGGHMLYHFTTQVTGTAPITCLSREAITRVWRTQAATTTTTTTTATATATATAPAAAATATATATTTPPTAAAAATSNRNSNRNGSSSSSCSYDSAATARRLATYNLSRLIVKNEMFSVSVACQIPYHTLKH